MCIAILNLSGIVPDLHIENSFQNNYDGAGMAWIESGKIKTYKTMNDLTEFMQTYKKIRKFNALPILLHFRISTHGKTNILNVHPFLIGDKMAMIHNGMIDFPLINKDLSDTHNFAMMLSRLSEPDQIMNPSSFESRYIQDICGNHSKMVFLSSDGEYQIINENKGHWIGDTWYSNSTYKDYGLYDFGGKSFPYSYQDELIRKESDLESLRYFADEYEIPVESIDPTGIDWDTDEAWDIENYAVIQGIYYFKESYESLTIGEFI